MRERLPNLAWGIPFPKASPWLGDSRYYIGQVFTTQNIQRGWQKAGLQPLSPITIYNSLYPNLKVTQNRPQTLANPTPFDLSLLDSSLPDGTELRQANTVLLTELSSNITIKSLVKRYLSRLTQAYEMTHSELTTIRKQVAAQSKLLYTRKKRTTGKRVALEGRFIFSKQEVVEIAQKAEAEAEEKKRSTKRRRRAITPELKANEEDVLENLSSDSEGSCITVVARRVDRTS